MKTLTMFIKKVYRTLLVYGECVKTRRLWRDMRDFPFQKVVYSKSEIARKIHQPFSACHGMHLIMYCYLL